MSILAPHEVLNKTLFCEKAAEFPVETDSKWQNWAATPGACMFYLLTLSGDAPVQVKKDN